MAKRKRIRPTKLRKPAKKRRKRPDELYKPTKRPVPEGLPPTRGHEDWGHQQLILLKHGEADSREVLDKIEERQRSGKRTTNAKKGKSKKKKKTLRRKIKGSILDSDT